MLLAQILTHATQSIVHVLAQETPVDTTGVNDALYSVARLLAGFVGGGLAIGLVVEGYQYMFSDSASRGGHLKRSLAILIGGAVLVVVGATAAPIIIGLLHPATPK